MKKTIFISIISLLFIFSCNNESNENQKENETTEKDTLTSMADTIELNDDLPGKRLPKHMGSWIDHNLDNEVFNSEKVDEMVTKSTVKYVDPQEAVVGYVFDFLKEKDLKKLNVKELLYYALAYPASYSQVCAEGLSDTTRTPKISGYIPFSYEGEEMSELQWNEINFRRDSVIISLTEFMLEYPEKIETEYLRILKRLDAYEAIPAVIATASKDRPDNYSFLLEMMYDNEFSSLRDSDIYSRLYGEESSRYDNRIESTSEVRKKIIQLGEDFYGYMHAH